MTRFQLFTFNLLKQYKFGRQITHLLGYYNVLVGDEFSVISNISLIAFH